MLTLNNSMKLFALGKETGSHSINSAEKFSGLKSQKLHDKIEVMNMH